MREQLTTDIEKYAERYLRQWDERATVRSRPRTRLSAETAALPMFPAALMPVLKHEALANLGDRAHHEYSVRAACQFQHAVALLEIDPVAELCGKLAGHGMGVVLPQPVQQVALTIATDEAYHALAAREFIADAERLTGIGLPGNDRLPDPLLDALLYFRQAAPSELLRPVEAMVLCFAENYITGEMFGLTEDAASDGPFQIVLREHLVDEGRHQVFFQNLLRHLWRELDEDARVALGPLLPKFLDIFLTNHHAFLEAQVGLLSPMGFDRESSVRIIKEAFSAAYGSLPAEKHKLFQARNSLKLLATAGISDHAPTREALLDSGWIAG